MPPGEVIARGEKPKGGKQLHGSVLAELFRMFENLKHVQPTQLIGFARTITAINFDTRLVLVHELNTAITAIREKHGPPPIDDGLPGESVTPYRAIRAIVLTPSPHHEGAHRGEARPSNSHHNMGDQS